VYVCWPLQKGWAVRLWWVGCYTNLRWVLESKSRLTDSCTCPSAVEDVCAHDHTVHVRADAGDWEHQLGIVLARKLKRRLGFVRDGGIWTDGERRPPEYFI
jgi:hypothetical protein